MRSHPLRPRHGLTLIELLVAMGILLLLAALTVAFVPRVQEAQKATRAADMMVRWSVTAKQRALRDQRPTGLRITPLGLRQPIVAQQGITSGQQFTVDRLQGTNELGWPMVVTTGSLVFVRSPDGSAFEVTRVVSVPNTNSLVLQTSRSYPNRSEIMPLDAARDLEYIQQPADFQSGFLTLVTCKGNPQNGIPARTFAAFDPAVLGFGAANSVDSPVLSGDYLELNGVGMMHAIRKLHVQVPTQYGSEIGMLPQPIRDRIAPQAGVRPAVLEFEPFFAPALPFSGNNQVPDNLITANYRIVRQPRPLEGEQPLQLPQDVGIDLLRSQNVPMRIVSQGAQSDVYFEILFAPNGGLLGTGSLNPIFWLRDMTLDSPFQNDPVLVTISTGTGQTGAHPVDTGPDPYIFARDGRSSGL